MYKRKRWGRVWVWVGNEEVDWKQNINARLRSLELISVL